MAFERILIAFALILANYINLVENKSIYGIGKRIAGDQLLLKDVLHVRSAGLEEKAQLKFEYSIPEPISYLEILSENNVHAHVYFSYDNDIVRGAVESDIAIPNSEPFEVLITIYGFNETAKYIDPTLVLNQRNEYVGELRPSSVEDAEDDDSEYEDYNDNVENTNNSVDYLYINPPDGTEGQSLEDNFEEDGDDKDFEPKDKIIEIGERQNGDLLLYHTYQSSMDTKERSNHSVVFYYIDSTFITQVKFVLFDHFETKNVSMTDYVPPLAEYSYFSPHSLKAVITDFNATFLFVEIYVYGYTPHTVQNTYQPFIKPTAREGDVFMSGVLRAETEAPLSPLQRIKHLLNDCDNKEEPSDDLVIPVKQGTHILCPEPTEKPCPSSASRFATCGLLAFSLGFIFLKNFLAFKVR